MKILASLLIALLVLFSEVALAWDPIRDLTGKRLDQHIDRGVKDLKNLPKSWSRCAGDPVKCAEKEIRRIPYRAVQPALSRYKAHLFNQGNGRFYRLPQWIINNVNSQYSVDLNQIRFAVNIDTLHGKAITWENTIFFPRRINLADPNDLHWMLHEIEHSVQYRNKGGFSGFFGEYFLNAVGKIIKHGSFDVHDNITVERAANSKANFLMRKYFQGSRNTRRYQDQPTTARYCIVGGGSCLMGVPVPVGSQCYCPSIGGPVWGRAR